MENPSSVGNRRESSLGILPVKCCDVLICSDVSDSATPWTVAHQGSQGGPCSGRQVVILEPYFTEEEMEILER